MFELLMPRTNRDFFDNFDRFFTTNTSATMRTDVRETENEYQLAIELPGYKKEDVKISLKDGYLTVEANHKEENNDDSGKLLRREIFYGTQSRSYYVGNIDQNLINASFENGILHIGMPKEEMAIEDKTNYIAIQ